MKQNVIAGFTALLLLSSCSYHYYYYGTPPEGTAPVAVKTDIVYDSEAPTHILVPQVERESKDYNPLDYNTFAVFTGLHTVEAPVGEDQNEKYAIWCTKQGTYLAEKEKMLWDERYFQCPSDIFLRDSKTGKKYSLRKVWGLPLNETYWLHSVAGEWFCRVYEYGPLDPECVEIDIVNDTNEPLEHIPGTTGWGYTPNYMNVRVADLQANQQKMAYKKTVIVK